MSGEGRRPLVSFIRRPGRWEKWLARNHARSNGVWLRIQKKGPGLESPTYAEALDAALCWGWIDGRKKSAGKGSWLQLFTRRRSSGAWSKRNTEHAGRLIREGRMKAAGLAEIEAAKGDGRWKAAYAPQSESVIPRRFPRRARAKQEGARVLQSRSTRRTAIPSSYRLGDGEKAGDAREAKESDP